MGHALYYRSDTFKDVMVYCLLDYPMFSSMWQVIKAQNHVDVTPKNCKLLERCLTSLGDELVPNLTKTIAVAVDCQD